MLLLDFWSLETFFHGDEQLAALEFKVIFTIAHSPPFHSILKFLQSGQNFLGCLLICRVIKRLAH